MSRVPPSPSPPPPHPASTGTNDYCLCRAVVGLQDGRTLRCFQGMALSLPQLLKKKIRRKQLKRERERGGGRRLLPQAPRSRPGPVAWPGRPGSGRPAGAPRPRCAGPGGGGGGGSGGGRSAVGMFKGNLQSFPLCGLVTNQQHPVLL